MESKHREYIRRLKDEWKKKDEITNRTREQGHMEIEDLRELMRRIFEQHQLLIEKSRILEDKVEKKRTKVKLLKDAVNVKTDQEQKYKDEINAKAAKIEELEDELRVKIAQYVKANTRLYDLSYQETLKQNRLQEVLD